MSIVIDGKFYEADLEVVEIIDSLRAEVDLGDRTIKKYIATNEELAAEIERLKESDANKKVLASLVKCNKAEGQNKVLREVLGHAEAGLEALEMEEDSALAIMIKQALKETK
jgi:DNA-binding transcriptional MerR regulator